MENEIKKPVGEIVIKFECKHQPIFTEHGTYYHYSDICGMIKVGQAQTLVKQGVPQPVLLAEKAIEKLIRLADRRFNDVAKYDNYSSMAILEAYKNGLEEALIAVQNSKQSA